MLHTKRGRRIHHRALSTSVMIYVCKPRSCLVTRLPTHATSYENYRYSEDLFCANLALAGLRKKVFNDMINEWRGEHTGDEKSASIVFQIMFTSLSVENAPFFSVKGISIPADMNRLESLQQLDIQIRCGQR